MLTVLVLCTGNSCRSQMAEGYLRHLSKGKITVYSAGIEVHGVNPMAIEVMKEDGIDISRHTSNHIDEYKSIPFDLILTVCDHAKENCPYFPSKATRLHKNFPDPAKVTGTGPEIMDAFRATRDQIKAYTANLLQSPHLNQA
ncbi:MAG TPA: arsenate reductase ArsC [Cyclobacteriaceae bacterium]|nr:arsenate reductase ArsC [Cyclobacteriaceae bacterium]